jgi:magnesium transporter
MVTTIVLFRGLKAPASQIITLVMGFLVICFGITILQMSKVDPEQLGNKLDRRSTMLLQAAKQNTELVDEKGITGIEEPGIDALRGSFGTVGSIIRARSARRMSQSSHLSGGPAHHWSSRATGLPAHPRDTLAGMQRHQLHDPPVPRFERRDSDAYSMQSQPSARKQTIKFGDEDLVHEYHRGAGPDEEAIHKSRPAPYGGPGNVVSPHSKLSSLSETMSVSTNESSKATAGSQFSGLPTVEYDRGFYGLRRDNDAAEEMNGLRTAPPSVGGLSGPYYDPFEQSPLTAAVSTFSPIDEHDELDHIRGSRHTSYAARPSIQQHGKEGSARSMKSYPKSNDRQTDAEESVGLFRAGSDDDGDDDDGMASTESSTTMKGGIRLVQPRPSRFWFFFLGWPPFPPSLNLFTILSTTTPPGYNFLIAPFLIQLFDNLSLNSVFGYHKPFVDFNYPLTVIFGLLC